jgi:hypothetical protein
MLHTNIRPASADPRLVSADPSPAYRSTAPFGRGIAVSRRRVGSAAAGACVRPGWGFCSESAVRMAPVLLFSPKKYYSGPGVGPWPLGGSSVLLRRGRARAGIVPSLPFYTTGFRLSCDVNGVRRSYTFDQIQQQSLL